MAHAAVRAGRARSKPVRSRCVRRQGQLFAHLKAIEFYLRQTRRLPVNLKCLFEGEEEIGSPNLKPFVARNRRALACDAVVMSDTRMLGPDRPAITYALRGSLSLELEVKGAAGDLHSGNYGGALHNPLQALCEIVAKLHDSSGRITVPGIYDRVRCWGSRERDYMARVGPTDREILAHARTARGWGECGYSLYERTTIRPALNVTGITGGHQGAGGKSIVPARALAKIDIRLVPDQDPSEIERLFRAHICRLTPAAVRSEVRTFFRRAALVDRNHPAMRAAFAAYRQGFGVAPVFVRSGGSIPVVNEFQELLGAPTVLMGFALPDDRIHAPNEKFHLPNFSKAWRRVLRFCVRWRRWLELHRAVFNPPVLHHRQIFHVVLVQAPRRLRSLVRERMQGAQDVSGVEIDHRLLFDVRIVNARRACGITVAVHVVQQPAHVLGGEVAFQSP